MDKQAKIKGLLSRLDALEHDGHQGTIMPILETLSSRIEKVSSEAVPHEAVDELKRQLSDISTSVRDELDSRDQDTSRLVRQLRDEIAELGTSSETVTDSKLSLLQGKIDGIPPADFSPIEARLKAALADIESKIPALPEPLDTEALKADIISSVAPSITQVRQDFIAAVNKGGGQANRSVRFSGSVLGRYGDINLLGASFSNNDATKTADVTLGGGSGTFTSLTYNVEGSIRQIA